MYVNHIRYYLRYYVRILLLIVYIFFSDKKMILPDSFVLWVWILYIANIFLSYHVLGLMKTAKDITKIYLNSKPGENHKKYLKMYSALIPFSKLYSAFFWGILDMLSFGMILIYQGLILGICADVFLFILIAILPIYYNLHLRSIFKHFAEPESRLVKCITESGFEFNDVKFIVEKAIAENINLHKWWMKIKKRRVSGGEN
jgi:hypothetical protein